MRPPALVLGGSANALAIVRSLGRDGIRVFHSGKPGSSAAHSRYCHSSFPIAARTQVQEGWEELLLGAGSTGVDGAGLDGAVLLACDDEAIEFLATFRDDLSARYVLDDSIPELMHAMLDKGRSMELAAKAGVPVPMRWEVGSTDELARVLHEFTYPVIVKPVHSHRFQSVLGKGGRKFLVADTEAQLKEHFDTMIEHGLRAIVSEKIPGPDALLGSYYTYIDGQGRALFHYTKKIIRRYPKNEGLASYHKTEWDDDIAEMGRRFFEGIGFRGLGNVEFKRDPRDGSLKLIECNPRFTAAQELLVKSGMDTGLLVYRHLTGGIEPVTERVRDGLHFWYPDRDMMAFRELASAGEIGLLGWIRSLWHRQCFPYFRITDPLPSLRRMVRKLRGAKAA